MRQQVFKVLVMGLAIGVALCSQSCESRAGSVIVKGKAFDLFQTDPSGTSFPGLGNLKGVPIEKYDFFGNGAVNTGRTDTIVEREDDAVAPVNPPPFPVTAPRIHLLIEDLQLETVKEVDFNGKGEANYFVTLQSARSGGMPSEGSMDITYTSKDGGTFNSLLKVFFDIRKWSPTGDIVYSGETDLTSTDTSWTRIAPRGAVELLGVNKLLNGQNTDEDFWPGPMHNGPHFVGPALQSSTVPEPTTWIMYLTAVLILSAGARWRRHRAQPSARG